jgi:uncharacterized repeat protein (TIGR03803 family)
MKIFPGIPCALIVSLAILTPRNGAAQAPAYAVLYSFQGSPDGSQPAGGVLLGNDGSLYGATYAGGTNQCYNGSVVSCGAIYRLSAETETSWKETVLYNFGGADGASPNANLVFSGAGSLYGTTAGGGSGGAGTIFQLTPPSLASGHWAEAVLYNFSGYYSQNEYPNGPVYVGGDGVLYTTTQGSPAQGVGAYLGAVNALAPPAASGGAWKEYVINRFSDGGVLGGARGAQPLSGVVSEDGALFGTTWSAGDVYCSVFGCGVVYKLTPPATHGAWTETVIYTFTGPPDGAFPQALLTVGPRGVLYGTTTYGGSGACVGDAGVFEGCGTVFQLTPPETGGGSWTESVIHTFTGIDGDGANPAASVTVGPDGVLYGTTQTGGSDTGPCPSSYVAAAGCGTVFELVPPANPGDDWTEKVLYAFSNQNGDGAYPTSSLALGPAGVLYGTTSAGGTAGLGTVFAIRP